MKEGHFTLSEALFHIMPRIFEISLLLADAKMKWHQAEKQRIEAERRFSTEEVRAIGHGSEEKEGIFVRALKISNQRIMHCVHDRMNCAHLELQT
jgi:hypothetical protein